nr:WD40 repeat domain-containing protein [uncultured Campylobacter sp.]
MKFLPPLLLYACFIYASNGVAAPSGAVGIDAPAKIKHASFILELDANVAVLKNLDGEIYAGLDNGKLYKITINSAENSTRNSTAGQNFADQNSAASTNSDAAQNFNAKASVNFAGDSTENSAAVNSLANSAKQNSAENSTALNSASGAISKTLIFALPSSKNYLDEPMGATIFDVDKLGERYAFLYNGDAFEKMLGIFASGKITHYKLPMTGIKNVYFYDENTVILLGLGSEILYFDLSGGKVSFEQKLTIASLGGSAYDRASGTLLISCEGGIVFYFDAKAKKLMSQKSLHKDGIYSVALLGDRMMSGSNDKERSCYYENGDFAKFYNAHFAVFAVALSPELGAFTVNNGVQVIDKAGEIVRSIELDNDIINYLLFEGDYLVGSGYNRYIYFWRLK